MTRSKALAILLFALFSHQAVAIVTSPVSFTPSSTCCSYVSINLINGSGLAGGLDGGLHDTAFQNMWLGNEVSPTLDFDMGAVYAISAAHIWQYNYDPLNRGINGFDIFYSLNGVDYTFLSSANLTVSPGGAIPVQVVPMVVNARYIRFEVTSNHGSVLYSGLSEVAFDVGPVPTNAIPSLSLWTTLVLSLLVLMIGFRRFRLI